MDSLLADQVRAVAAQVFDVPVEQITADTSPRTLADWDSVQHLNLVLALEARLGVRFDPREIEQMQSIDAAIELAGRRLAAKGPS